MNIQPVFAPGNPGFSDKTARITLWQALGTTTLLWVCFKVLYPSPDFTPDSYRYLFAARAHLNANILPIGYSWFLLGFHAITHSATALVSFQYCLLVVAGWRFYNALLRYFNPGNFARYLILAFLFFNPLFLYLSNSIGHEALFTALSLFWLAELMAIIYRPTVYRICSYAFLLFLCCVVSGKGLCYIPVSVLAILLSGQRMQWKELAILAPFLFLLPFIGFTRHAVYKMTGNHLYSMHAGWQWANNALYMYKDIQVDPASLPTAATRRLDSLAKGFTLHLIPDFHRYLEEYNSDFFIQEPVSPLQLYVNKQYKITDPYSDILAWGKAAPVFAAYGQRVILQNPLTYARYYLWVNTKNYFAPALGTLELYNLGREDVGRDAADWFSLGSQRLKAASLDIQATVLFIFAPIVFLVNICLLVCGGVFLFRKKSRPRGPIHPKMLLLTAGLLLADYIYSVNSSIVVLRNEVFPLTVGFCVAMILLEGSNKTKGHAKG